MEVNSLSLRRRKDTKSNDYLYSELLENEP